MAQLVRTVKVILQVNSVMHVPVAVMIIFGWLRCTEWSRIVANGIVSPNGEGHFAGQLSDARAGRCYDHFRLVAAEWWQLELAE